MGGCSLAVLGTDRLQVGDVCVVQVGKLAPLRAEVRWRNELDDKVLRVGFMFLE